jgi:hypothetical protein
MPKPFLLALAATAALAACSPRSDDASTAGGAAASTAAAAPTDPAAPDSFDVRFETSRGPFVVRARRAWAPHGVDRFHALVQAGFFD